MRRCLVFLLVLLYGAITVQAQSDCGNGLPCGPIPWPLPRLPDLQSPTPMPTVVITQAAAAPPDGTPTATPTATPTFIPGTLDTTGIDDNLATLQKLIETTPETIYNIEGTPVDTEAVFTELGENAGDFFGYAKGMTNVTFGAWTPLVSFTLLAMVTVISVKLLGFLLPFLMVIFGIIRKIVQLILDFLPF